MNNVIQTTPASILCINVHISHPAMPITTTHLHTFQHHIRPRHHQHLSNLIIYHHLQITALPPPIPRDRSLYITIDNIICVMPPRGTDNMAVPHHLHLFLSPYNSLPYLWYTYGVDEQTTYRLEITTSLSSTRSRFNRTRRQSMVHTTTHAPDLVTTFTFSAEFTQ